MSPPFELSSSLIGTLVVFAIFALVAWALLREAAKWVVRAILIVAVGVGIAVWAGWLEQTAAGEIFQWIGDNLLIAIKAVTGWLLTAWESISAGASGR